jgi:hypothetical protein
MIAWLGLPTKLVAPASGAPAASRDARERSGDTTSELGGGRATAHLADRPALPWPYVAILIAEALVLATLAATAADRPPFSYEIGWLGCGSMIVMQLYSVRRRVRALRHLGSLRGWLDAHVFLGLQGFVLVGYHSIGVSPNPSLAALNFGLVLVVVVSGLFGRYFFVMIPRTRAGDVLAHAALADPARRGAPPRAGPARCRGVIDLVRLDLARRRSLRALRRDPDLARAHAARRAITLASRIAALEVAERWCARWTLLHRPLAILLFASTTLHVLAHFAYAA